MFELSLCEYAAGLSPAASLVFWSSVVGIFPAVVFFANRALAAVAAMFRHLGHAPAEFREAARPVAFHAAHRAVRAVRAGGYFHGR